MRYELTDDFIALNEPEGLIQNLSPSASVEIAETEDKSSGMMLKPGQSVNFAGKVYVRKHGYGGGVIAVLQGAGYGGGDSPDFDLEGLTQEEIAEMFPSGSTNGE